MGAEYFSVVHEGENAKQAFEDARDEARYEYGHSGYTGTIAEKEKFSMATSSEMNLKDAEDLAYQLSEDGKFADKWGPAGCIRLTDGRWLFFGWASS